VAGVRSHSNASYQAITDRKPATKEDTNVYPERYFEIQMIFAGKIAEISGISYSDSLLRYSDLYGLLGLRWSEDLPVWHEFVAGLPQGALGIEHAYNFYIQRHSQDLIHDHPAGQPIWGCFSYDYHTKLKGVDIHFSDRDDSGFSSLSHQSLAARLAELRSMFEHVQREHPEAERVICYGTWLLNRVEYRRLFPPEQVRYTWVGEPLLFGTGLWGQFLRRGMRLDEPAAAFFLDRVARLTDSRYIASCFPQQAFCSDGPVSNFYRFYGLEVPHFLLCKLH
jgi:hypothetical protein